MTIGSTEDHLFWVDVVVNRAMNKCFKDLDGLANIITLLVDYVDEEKVTTPKSKEEWDVFFEWVNIGRQNYLCHKYVFDIPNLTNDDLDLIQDYAENSPFFVDESLK